MSLLSFLHNYQAGDIISSTNFDDEFNQILYALGFLNNNNGTSDKQLIVSTLSNTDAPLILDNLSTGDYIELNGNTVFKNNGQLVIGANGIVGIIINQATHVNCPNLNADLLGGKEAAELEQKLNGFFFYSTFWKSADLTGAVAKGKYICPDNGATITKLKARTPDTASADASTTFTYYKNGVSIGTLNIAGNTQAVQTNDIADNVLVAGDEILIAVTTYTGTTKHKNITAGFHFKKSH